MSKHGFDSFFIGSLGFVLGVTGHVLVDVFGVKLLSADVGLLFTIQQGKNLAKLSITLNLTFTVFEVHLVVFILVRFASFFGCLGAFSRIVLWHLLVFKCKLSMS